MAWDSTLPTNTTKIRNYPTVLTDNFIAIEGDISLKSWQMNFAERDSVPGAPPPAVDPTGTADTCILFSKTDPTGNPEMFHMDETSVISQLTFRDRSLAQSGYSYLAPGFLMQWGRGAISGGGSTAAIVFPVAFSSAAWSVNATPYATTVTGSSPREFGVSNGTITDLGFTAVSFNGTVPAGGVPFGWIAIGPM